MFFWRRKKKHSEPAYSEPIPDTDESSQQELEPELLSEIEVEKQETMIARLEAARTAYEQQPVQDEKKAEEAQPTSKPKPVDEESHDIKAETGVNDSFQQRRRSDMPSVSLDSQQGVRSVEQKEAEIASEGVNYCKSISNNVLMDIVRDDIERILRNRQQGHN